MHRPRKIGSALILVLFFGIQGAHAAPGPFAAMAGSWAGEGRLLMANGARERLRCRAVYDVAAQGNSLRLDLRCASDSYHFELAGEIEAQGDAISGSWSEATRNVAGTISGRGDKEHIEVFAAGAGFSASLALATRGNRQSVTIVPQGGEVSAVAMTLSKR